jgi:hypothetical protein
MANPNQKTEKQLAEQQDRFLNMTEDELRNYAALWYPGGPGPIGAMYAITALVRTVAQLRGMDITE